MLSFQELKKYSDLLLDYSLEIREGSKLLIQSTTLAEPLLIELYKGSMQRGAIIEISFVLKDQDAIFNQYASNQALQWVNPTYRFAMEYFDAYLYIRAPHVNAAYYPMSSDRQLMRRQALEPFTKFYNQRTGNRSMRRSLCQYPTQASANEADMTLEEYEVFVMQSCFLHQDTPIDEWKLLSGHQKHIVDYLNQCSEFTYINPKTNISFSTEGRTWINSDGKTNMPSGEVYSSPVEDSMNGHIFFDYPFLYQNQLIQGVSLEVEKGRVVKAVAEIGDSILQEIISTPGADYFGEVAIGTNPNINRPTRNILFDEKMAGTVHMAIGQSYLQCGGKNESILHQDMIADMREEGKIIANGNLIYKNGVFLI